MRPTDAPNQNRQFDPNPPDNRNPNADLRVYDYSYMLNPGYYYGNERDSKSPSPVRSPVPHSSPDNQEQHPCLKPGCSKIFSHIHKLQRHYRDAHGKPQYDCPFPNCTRKGTKGFARKDNMRQHHRLVHNKPLGPVVVPDSLIKVVVESHKAYAR